jgi:hypothetical protein
MSDFKKFLGAWDIHGNHQDPTSNKVLFKFLQIWKPDIRICGGDLWDFSPLRKGASEDEKRLSMKSDLKAGKDWFNKFKPTHFLRGNHDQRLWDLRDYGTGVAADFAYDGVAEIERMVKVHKCRMYPYHKRDGILRIGSLKALHGFYCGVYAARQHALTYGSCLFGHVHTIDEHSIPGLERRVARAIGCLCKTDMDYNSRMPNTLRQANGFPFGIIHKKSGRYYTWQAEEIDGRWIIPSDFTEL